MLESPCYYQTMAENENDRDTTKHSEPDEKEHPNAPDPAPDVAKTSEVGSEGTVEAGEQPRRTEVGALSTASEGTAELPMGEAQKPGTAHVYTNEPLNGSSEAPNAGGAGEPVASRAPGDAGPLIRSHESAEGRVKSLATRRSQKQRRLEKILQFLKTRERIANNDVEKLLRVSDATATRYLSELERTGTIQQIGKTGQSVFYVLLQ